MQSHKLLLTSLFTAVALSASAQGTAFTYEGQLQNNGSPASGTYNLTFTLFSTNISGVAIAGPVTNNGVGITNGLFTELIDFGPGAFTGATNWLEIAVATNGVNAFTTLAPRQQLTPTPYAIYAESASGLSGTLSAAQLTSLGNSNSVFGGNFFVGPSGNSTTSGYDNTAIGAYALLFNTSGWFNTANGFAALSDNMSGVDNTANGTAALAHNTSGSDNTANGTAALLANTTGTYNTASGSGALYSNTNGWFNTADGDNALYSNTSGNNNTANGYEALYNNTSGSLNTASGNNALLSNTTGSQNTANGTWALLANTTGSYNTASGSGALYYNTNGVYNTANGFAALYNNTSGSDNTANGAAALGSNKSGWYNTADGFGALYNNTNGWFNTAGGDNALNYNTSGNNNTANGYEALYYNTSGSLNTASGNNALLSNTTGSQNTANGTWALLANTTGSYNTASGSGTLYYNTNGSYNIALGYQAGYNFNGSESSNIDIGNPGVTGENNTIRIGSGQSQTFIAGVINGNGSGLTNLNAGNLTGAIPQAQMPAAVLTNNETGVMLTGTFSGNGSGLTSLDASQLTSIGNTNGGGGNFFVGGSGNSTNSGSGNTASGFGALNSNTSGSVNTANGYMALLFNTSGSANTANGYGTLVLNTNGSWNTANGVEALWNNSNGSFNTADGSGALLGNTSGSNNIALGYFAGFNITTGSSNIDIGNQGFSTDINIIRIGDGQSQTFIAGVINGNGGGLTNLNASQLTAIGNTNGGAGNFFVGQSGNATTSGSYNTANGYRALEFNTSGSYNIALGYQAGDSIITGSSNIDIGNYGLYTDSNIIRIGTLQTATYLAGTVYANGVALTCDRNAKENFTAVNAREVLAKVASLPVTEWNYKTDSKDMQHIGPMAQDFQAAFQLGTDDKHISVVDEGGVALAAIQGLNQKLNEKDAEIQTLKLQNDSLAERLNELEAAVKSLAERK